MRVLIVGGRYHTTREHTEAVLASFAPSFVLAAEHFGAATYAEHWAKREGVPCEHPVKLPPRPVLDVGELASRYHVDLVLAFEGASEAVALGVAAGVPVVEV